MSLKMGNEDRVLKITQHNEPTHRALILDRDAMSSHLLADTLNRNRKCDATAVLSADLLSTISASAINLVVIAADLNSCPGGFELADAVCRAYPDVIIVMLLNDAGQESVIQAFRSGARGVFSRQRPIAEFLDCIEHVKKGFIWAGRDETTLLLEAFKSIPAPSVLSSTTTPMLTKREFEVVQCAAKGKTNKTIAAELGLSEHTVKNYLFRAFDKLGVSSRIELLFYLTMRGHTFGAAHDPHLAAPFDLVPASDSGEPEV
jgi:two-component system, NarL family, nitrate/nitrite response regulator NarL